MSFEFVEIDGKSPTLVLFHGTGGTEHDLVQIGQDLMPSHRLLSPRGKVNEGGMNRWFRRFAEGVFDEEDIKLRAAELAEFLRSKKDGPMIGLGYSNGANIGAAMMLLQPDVLDGLVMWRGMLPLIPEAKPSLDGKRVLMLNGTQDMMGPIASAHRLRDLFTESGADVEMREYPTGHGLTQGDFLASQEWLAKFRS